MKIDEEGRQDHENRGDLEVSKNDIISGDA
jgi:hypothetical protein